MTVIIIQNIFTLLSLKQPENGSLLRKFQRKIMSNYIWKTYDKASKDRFSYWDGIVCHALKSLPLALPAVPKIAWNWRTIRGPIEWTPHGFQYGSSAYRSGHECQQVASANVVNNVQNLWKNIVSTSTKVGCLGLLSQVIGWPATVLTSMMAVWTSKLWSLSRKVLKTKNSMNSSWKRNMRPSSSWATSERTSISSEGGSGL